MAEARCQHRGLDEQVRHDDHQRPLPDRLGQFVEHLGQPGRPGRLGLLENVERQPQVRGAAAGGQRLHDAVGHAGDAHRVALLGGEVAQPRTDPPGVVDLRQPALGGEVHRPRRVEHEAQPEVRVGLVLLDVEPVGPAEGPPVEPPQVVAGHVLAVLGELHARAAVRARVPARHVADHRLAGEQGHARQPGEHGGLEEAAGLAVGVHGCARADNLGDKTLPSATPAPPPSPSPAGPRSAWRRCPPPGRRRW